MKRTSWRHIMIALVASCLMEASAPQCSFALRASYNFIPTADLLQPGQVALSFENDGYSQLFHSRESVNDVEAQVGLTNRFNIGFDAYDFSQNSLYVFNAKYLLVRESHKAPAFGVGVLGIGRGSTPTTFAAARKAWKGFRGHLGGVRNNGQTFLMTGAEYDLNDNLYVFGNWVSGGDGYATFGAGQRLKGEVWLTAAAGRPNDSEKNSFLSVNLSYVFKFKP